MPELQVIPFSSDAFYAALSGPRFSLESAKSHVQARYLAEYLADVNAGTMVVENEYVDGDYLSDFSSYYVSCFEPYERFCRRLHFFEGSFERSNLEDVMLGRVSDTERAAFQQSYLGFVVVRPLPNAIVGRTALRPYPSDNGRRHYTALVPYKVSLYGISLEVLSLAYQEQDTVLAACATVSIWSALHRRLSCTPLVRRVRQQSRPTRREQSCISVHFLDWLTS